MPCALAKHHDISRQNIYESFIERAVSASFVQTSTFAVNWEEWNEMRKINAEIRQNWN